MIDAVSATIFNSVRQKTVPARIPEDFFFSCVSGGICHRNVVLERSQEFLFFSVFTGIFRRNSCGTGIPVFTPESPGFRQEFLYLPRNPPDSGGFLFPLKAAGSGQ